jgi:cobalt-zinc-cadmium efflux system protein
MQAWTAYSREIPMSEEATDSAQRRILLLVLALNLLLVASLAVTGILADSSGLIANALDNASDAAVYVISLVAVGRSQRWKRVAAVSSGVLLLVFGLGVVIDACRRFVVGSEPLGLQMMGMAGFSAAVNLLCLRLLRRLGGRDVNLRAAETFSANDFVSNGGILVAGALVAWTGQRWPDLLVGGAVAVIAVKGGLDILGDARQRSSPIEPGGAP